MNLSPTIRIERTQTSLYSRKLLEGILQNFDNSWLATIRHKMIPSSPIYLCWLLAYITYLPVPLFQKPIHFEKRSPRSVHICTALFLKTCLVQKHINYSQKSFWYWLNGFLFIFTYIFNGKITDAGKFYNNCIYHNLISNLILIPQYYNSDSFVFFI